MTSLEYNSKLIFTFRGRIFCQSKCQSQKNKIYLASRHGRYTHGVTANQLYIDTLPCNAPNLVNSSNTHPFKWDDLIDFLLVWLLHVGADCCFRLLLLGFRWSFIHWSFLCNLLPCFRAVFFALLGTSGERETTHRLNLGSICYVDITLNYNSPLSWHRWTMLNMAT